jgi:hypothetical protein
MKSLEVFNQRGEIAMSLRTVDILLKRQRVV